MPTHLHWSDSRSVVRGSLAQREENRVQRGFDRHNEACNCGAGGCLLVVLENVLARRIAFALDEDHFIVQDSMPPKD
jgi:hypothetical protein